MRKMFTYAGEKKKSKIGSGKVHDKLKDDTSDEEYEERERDIYIYVNDNTFNLSIKDHSD